MTIRLIKYIDGIYLTPEYNVVQDDVKGFIAAYEGEGDADPDRAEDFVMEGGGKWNVMYVRRNVLDDSLSLVFKINLSSGEKARMDFYDMMGEVVEVKSNDTEPIELSLDAEPEATWNHDGGDYDLDGGVIKFDGGFHLCIKTQSGQMPSQDWVLLSSDGNHITLDKDTTVCITYP
jgi:hypothetical protein